MKHGLFLSPPGVVRVTQFQLNACMQQMHVVAVLPMCFTLVLGHNKHHNNPQVFLHFGNLRPIIYMCINLFRWYRLLRHTPPGLSPFRLPAGSPLAVYWKSSRMCWAMGMGGNDCPVPRGLCFIMTVSIPGGYAGTRNMHPSVFFILHLMQYITVAMTTRWLMSETTQHRLELWKSI